MKNFLVGATALAFGVVTGVPAAQAADVPMPWAYGFMTPPPAAAPAAPPTAPANPPPAPDNVTKLTVPGSTLTFTRAQLTNRFAPPDWFPEEHPPRPEV